MRPKTKSPPRAILYLNLREPWLACPCQLCERRPQCKLQCNRALAVLQYGEGPHPLPSSVPSVWLPTLVTVNVFTTDLNQNSILRIKVEFSSAHLSVPFKAH